MKTTKPLINSSTRNAGADNGKIEQSVNQRNPGGAKPEDFVVHQWEDGESVSGQRENDKLAARKSDTSNFSPFSGSNYQDRTELNDVGEHLGEEE